MAKQASGSSPDPTVGSDWTEQEVRQTVDAYFRMLHQELMGQRYIKAHYNRELQERFRVRSKQAVEFKFANISGVLIRLGLPYIRGYQPRKNFQALLLTQVEEWLERNPSFADLLEQSPVLHPQEPAKVSSIQFELPPDEIVVPQGDVQPWRSRRGRQIDYAAREAQNRHLGHLGEQWVVAFERERLRVQGRDDLAARVEWVAQTRGDGLGFDVLSFDEQAETERPIEVKTTTLGKFFPFFLSRNEVRCSQDLAGQYHLYRVFEFGQDAKVFKLQGDLSQALTLEPVQFKASLGR